MKLAKIMVEGAVGLGVLEEDQVRLLDLSQVENCNSLTDILHAPDPIGLTKFLIDTKREPVAIEEVRLLAPLDQQEIWAAGVTYKRSQVARMEESESAASHYDKVYTADRPEIFFKATPSRVSGPGRPVRVRFDSKWSVPEPEFAVVISPELEIVGYSIGNDMSARDIEGENPLYLPQAKMYNQCCGLGPCILLAGEEKLDLAKTKIQLDIERDNETVFTGETDLGELARDFDDLVCWLGRENDFPHGAILLTGTGIVPEDDFTLKQDDTVSIHVTGIGTLSNPVVREQG